MNIVTGLEEENVLQRVPWHELSFTDDLADNYDQPFLLHETSRGWVNARLLENPAQKRKLVGLACLYSVRVIKKHEEECMWSDIPSLRRLMLPHAERCYELRADLDTDTRDEIEWHVLGNLCMNQGAMGTAIGCFQLAFHNRTLTSLDRTQIALSLATIYFERNDLTQCRNTLSGIEINGKWKQDPVLDFRVHFAQAEFAAQGEDNIEKAVEEFSKLEQSQDDTSGSLDDRTLLCLHRLASSLKSLGNLQTADALYRRIVTSYGMKYGPSSSATLDAVEELAEILELQGELDGAVDLYKESVNLKTATLGSEHPNTATSQARLATIYCRMYEFKMSKELFTTSLGVLERTVGNIHPSTIATRENYALSLLSEAEEENSASAKKELHNKVRDLMNDVVQAKTECGSSYSEEDIEESRKTLREVLGDINSASSKLLDPITIAGIVKP
jgi:tetratricopeptide (TPR) repeat protein